MSDSILQAPKGTRDLTGAEVRQFARLEQVARDVFGLFHFSEIRTPIFEPVELFSRSLGETSDVVEKEMFTFTDRGERTFALRPEGTAGVVRHFIEADLSKKAGQHRLFYVGPMFRGERPQAGRYRQFSQIGSEYFGTDDAVADAETVLVADMILRRFGLDGFTIHVNTLGCKQCRAAYRDALLAYLKKRESELSEESRRRMNINPLRVLDSKVDGPKLGDAPTMKQFLCEGCRAHYAQFLRLLTEAKAPIQEDPRLVRGLDYYSRSVFEFVSPDLGAQSALAAGGRYDELVSLLGGPPTPAVGFALGMDRLVAALAARQTKAPEPSSPVSVVVIPMEPDAVSIAFSVANRVREAGFAVPPLLPSKKLKNQLSSAVDIGANWAILIGGDEIKANTVTLKNLIQREQHTLSHDDLLTHLKKG